ncbi:MAG: RNA pseudouridine synthase [Deltaproteobacteria bacterium]|nr:MAG: RNA pseudouridine synthase [Deltaproteobacteria bacterium]
MGLKKPFEIKVEPEDNGKRIDTFLAEKFSEISRSRWKTLIEEKNILINNIIPKPSQKIHVGDIITGSIPEPSEIELIAEPIPLKIIYEDEYIIVIDKAPNIVVHPGAGNPSGTIVNALLYHVKNLKGIGGELRPGVVHRLDKGTSGVMVFAKDEKSLNHLSYQFKTHQVKKEYIALIFGKMEEEYGTINLPIGRDPINRKRMKIREEGGREAITNWIVEELFKEFSLVKAMPITGRTHQIRTHFSYIGHPVVGDPLYSSKTKFKQIKNLAVQKALKEFKRQALHAQKLGFTHPITNSFLEFFSPIPEDMNRLISIIRMESEKNDKKS